MHLEERWASNREGGPRIENEHKGGTDILQLARRKPAGYRLERANTPHDTRWAKLAKAEPRNVAAALVRAVESKDAYTADHMREVAEVANSIGIEMGFTPRQVETLYIGALLHDVGKIGIPGSILNKQGRLSVEEYELIKQHPITGARIIEPLAATLSEVIPAVMHHHERYDGHGYPDGLGGQEIPVEARIILVADAFDSMIRDRAYRRSVSPKAAVREIVDNAGTQFDPEIVWAFVRTIVTTDRGPFAWQGPSASRLAK